MYFNILFIEVNNLIPFIHSRLERVAVFLVLMDILYFSHSYKVPICSILGYIKVRVS